MGWRDYTRAPGLRNETLRKLAIEQHLRFTRAKRHTGLDSLADRVRFGFEWRVPGIRRDAGGTAGLDVIRAFIDPAAPEPEKSVHH